MAATQTALPYRIKFELRQSYLYVRVEAERSDHDSARGCWKEILRMVASRRYERVLIDRRITHPLPIADVFPLMADASCVCHNLTRIAIVDRSLEGSNTCEEAVATPNAMYMKLFTDYGPAENWLYKPSAAIKDFEIL